MYSLNDDEMSSISFGKSKILTFSSMSVIWSSMKATSLEKTGRSRGLRAQHLHIILYLEKLKRWISRREGERERGREGGRKERRRQREREKGEERGPSK